MASCAVVTNIAPKTIENDRGAKQKQKAAENASKADEIQHGREMKVKYIIMRVKFIVDFISWIRFCKINKNGAIN